MAFLVRVTAHHQVTAVTQPDGIPMSMGLGDKRYTAFVNADHIASITATVIEGVKMENFVTMKLADGAEYAIETKNMKPVWKALASKDMIAK